MSGVASLLLGAIAACSLAIALFFVRYWRSSRDRFYLLFAASFFIESVNRAVVGAVGAVEYDTVHYGIRFVSYALIAVAIWDKNRRR